MSETIDPNGTDHLVLSGLRKADAWTGLILAIVAAAMIAKALTFPLAGTYAGVKNAWYVSPALFPLIVGGMLMVLSLGLTTRAFRDHRRLRPGTWVLGLGQDAFDRDRGRHAILISGLMAAYIVGLVPRIDFILATALFLLAFIGAYVLEARRGRILVVACLAVPSVVALAVAFAGAWPAPRSSAQYYADAVVAAVLVLCVILFAAAAHAERRRIVPVVATALGTAVILSGIFKYGLLVPLPREGAAVALMDAAVDPLLALLR